MASPSKENHILKLILENSPLKQWHFDEIVKEAKVTRAVANKWLKKYIKNKVLQRVKKKGKFPYFTAGKDNMEYLALKRMYALEQLYDSGMVADLLSQEKARTIILFGSMIKGDWYKDSDVDIFVFGNASDFDKNIYQNRLKRYIELHVFKTIDEIKSVKTGLIKNVINGHVIKGRIQDIAEVS